MDDLPLRKPSWLKTRITHTGCYGETAKILQEYNLHTICSSGRCPNQGECWSKGIATLMIAGEICTRNCKFCNTLTGKPLPLSQQEPQEVADAVNKLQLKHVVLTSVTRDDLPDGGAAHWAKTIMAIKKENPMVTIEVLIPDFGGDTELLDQIEQTAPHIIAHNLETVRRLTPLLRSGAQYDRSLGVIKYLANKNVITKSALMFGVGETIDEIYATIDDIANAGCKILCMGQYLQPTRQNLPVKVYVTPEQFNEFKIYALSKGIKQVESAPLVRSSYHATLYNDLK